MTDAESHPLARWQGQPLQGKTILLYSEMGFGDEILSLRFAEPVKALGARVILAVRSEIVRLAQGLPWADCVVEQGGARTYGVVEVLQYDRPPWQPDFVCSLLAVPVFVTGAAPDGDGYLLAAQGLRIAHSSGGWRSDPYFSAPACRPNAQPRPLVGICWASGNADPGFAARKSLTLRQLEPVLRSGVTLLSLQHEHSEDLRTWGIVDAMQGVTDFADTAAIIDQLDLVITVDTAVAHLAGALGKPVWTLVRTDKSSVWPWLWDTQQTPWYASMTLYRQSQASDWSMPLNRLFADFVRWIDRAPAIRRV